MWGIRRRKGYKKCIALVRRRKMNNGTAQWQKKNILNLLNNKIDVWMTGPGRDYIT
jgi:hypothetical protein